MRTLSATLCFIAVLLNHFSTALTAGYEKKNQGDYLTMLCRSKDPDHTGLYLIARCPEVQEIFFYFNDTKTITIEPQYEGRVHISGPFENLRINITGLKQTDSGVYSCLYEGTRKTETDAVLLFVNEVEDAVTAEVTSKESRAVPEMLVMVSALTAFTVVILCVLVTVVWIIPKVKTLCERQRDDSSRTHNSVYEDMRAHRTQI